MKVHGGRADRARRLVRGLGLAVVVVVALGVDVAVAAPLVEELPLPLPPPPTPPTGTGPEEVPPRPEPDPAPHPSGEAPVGVLAGQATGDAGGESSRAGTAPAPAGGGSRRSTGQTVARRSSAPVPSPAPAPVAVLPSARMEAEPAVARLRRVSVPAAREFRFPLVLAGLVLAFLAVQGRLDKRDPKLVLAPVSVDDDLLPFR